MEIKHYSAQKKIVKFAAHCVSPAVALDRAAFAALAVDGVVPAGTFVQFDLKNRATKATPATEANITGVLRYDVKLTGKDADHAAAIIEGYVDLDQIPVAPTAAQEAALRKITFMR